MPSNDRLREAGLEVANDVPNAHEVFIPDAPVSGPPRRNANALVPVSGGTFTYKRFQLTPTGLICPANMTFNEWEDIGHVIRQLDGQIGWLIGDWFNAGIKQQYGDLKRLAEKFGYEPQTVRQYVSVVRKVSIRNLHLSLAHHRLVTRLNDEGQRYWLGEAERGGWSVGQMREAMNPTSLSGDENQKNIRRSLEKLGKLDSAHAEQLNITKSQELLLHIEVARRHLDELEYTVRNAKNI